MALADLLFEGVELAVEAALEAVGERAALGGGDDEDSRDENPACDD